MQMVKFQLSTEVQKVKLIDKIVNKIKSPTIIERK